MRRIHAIWRVAVGLAFLVMLAGLGSAAGQQKSTGPKKSILSEKVNLIPEFKRLGLSPEDQGARDVCSLFAVTAIAEFEYGKHGGEKSVALSPAFCIWAAHDASGLSGEQAMLYMAVHGLNARGICKQTLMPYAAKGTSMTRPTDEAIEDANQLTQRWSVHWIRRWDIKSKVTDLQHLEIKKALAAGHPLACGFRWPVGLQGSSITAVPPPDRVHDGHTVVLVGYEADPKAAGNGFFRFRNSAGPAWGDNGHGTLSFAYAKAYLNDALWLEYGPRGAEQPIERFEAEEAPILGKAQCETSVQEMTEWGGGMWSRNKQLFCSAKKGGYVDLGFDVKTAGSYRLRLLATAAPDYGVVVVALDGKKIETRFDLYCGRVSPAGSLEVGQHALSAGRHQLRITTEGKNAVSAGTQFGIDAIDLLPTR